jgi:glucokinase
VSEARVVGVDVGGTKILAGLVTEDGTIEALREARTPQESQDALLRGVEETVESLIDDRVVALGFGIPSRIDQRHGVVIGSVNVPLAGFRFRDHIEQRFGLPAQIDNDGNTAAIAEWTCGAARGATDVVMLTLGTGVGAGLVLDGRPYRGFLGGAAEIGHMVIAQGGRLCGCGRRGHLEAYVSGGAADRAAAEAFGPGADAVHLVQLADEGDATAIALLTEIGHSLGVGLGSIVNVLEPEVIVIGGGFAAAGEWLLGPAREAFAREALDPGRDIARIALAELGPAAGMVGAALVGYELLHAAAPRA